MAASTEEKELAELRQLLGDDELNRLRPTGAATKAYAAYTPARRAATAPVSKGGGAGGTKQQAAFEDEGASDSDSEVVTAKPSGPSARAPWDDRSGRASEHLSARQRSSRDSRREKYGSARYGAGEYTSQYISRKQALQWYHKELDRHADLWQMRQMQTAAYMAPLYVAAEARHKHSKEIEARPRPPSRVSFRDASLSERMPTGAQQQQQQRTTATASKGDLQEEGEVGTQEASEQAMRGRKGGRISQTSRAPGGATRSSILRAEASRTSRTPAAGNGQTSSRWAPSSGWDSSPLRTVPHTLRGSKPVTDEPWQRDEELKNRLKAETDRKFGAGGGKKARAASAGSNGSKTSSPSLDSRPAWDSSKRTAWDAHAAGAAQRAQQK